ncbi:hypothetical protein BV898_17508 [Hypsibius exemplaris]|uniref:Cadherin domain-containing protein n=1 Tax=Hypsibius exemplaris TaxID=2072580 RepID=A0A9X6RM41_HYPEX|nr:hypothetical protein BV898_17508 [Hypsibius exemplaris]
MCIGPGGSLVGNIGTGSTKLGVCGCLPGSFHNATIDQCVKNLTIAIATPGVISACTFLNDPVTSSGANLTVATGGGVRPIQYIIGVFNSSYTGTASDGQTKLYATTPLIAIDQNTGQVYATYAPNTAVTQCYEVVAIDANNQVSAPAVFCVATAAYSLACSCGPVTTTAAPVNACTCPSDF